MNVADYQRAVMRVSFALEPSPADLALLGDEKRFRMYRHMVRSRLEGMAELAFKLSLARAGHAAFLASYARFLASGGAKSPLIREVTAAFGRFARKDAELLALTPPDLSDLVLFELAKWEVAYLPAAPIAEAGLSELDFEGKPVLNPTLRRLSLNPEVLPACEVPAPVFGADGRFHLLVYRPSTVNDVRWWAIGPFFAAVLERIETGANIATAVSEVASTQGRAVDEALLEELATDLTLAVQRGVLLGVLRA